MHPEILAKFQAVAPKCYFCQCPHQGQGYENELRMLDCISGVEPYLGAYLCPDCKHRKPEMDAIERKKMQRRDCIERLRETGLFRFNVKYKLSDAKDALIGVPGLYDYLSEWPLTHNVWLWSKTCGIGKTHTARCVGSRYVYHSMDVAELNGMKLFNLSEFYGREREEKMKPYLDAALLIIDDIDKAVWTQKSVLIIYEILDERFDRGLRTIITSNMQPMKLVKNWDEFDADRGLGNSIWDRMKPFESFEMRGRPRRDQD